MQAYAILFDMTQEVQDTPPEWVEQVRARGLGGVLNTALDILEPLGPLGAQLIWVAQPVLGGWLGRETLGELAEMLESPERMDSLRRYLDE
ncbi:MAG: hypothetical protein J0L63_20015 [Anaerolineae bacterium]|nr:hypothetical protein [Anaerolineae bacterium]MBN8621209.1 hypothetical protein [Anaerolineae bacterium]